MPSEPFPSSVLPSTPAGSPPWSRALALAERAIGVSDPNPRVGCVLTDAAGRVIGEGATQAAGGPHAEVMALRDAAARGADVRGATAWVTLEPCAHHGRTPPCCDALIAAGLGAVRVALADPFPAVAGRGLERLRAAGLDVTCCDDPAVVDAAFELNIGFFSRVLRARPWVRMKVAVSLDGRTALPDGRSRWITGTEARRDGHAWRRRAGAVLTGVGTVVDDDPRLDVREVETVRQPVRVIVDSRLRTPPAARILQPPGDVWIAHADPLDGAAARLAAAALQSTGAALIPLPAPGGKTDLSALLSALAARGVNELHVEAGEKLNGSFLRAGLVDELLVYQAPRLLGDGAPLAALGTIPALDASIDFTWLDIARVGVDLRMRLRMPEAAAALRRAMQASPCR
jgi:diaminohydroxyphosphoribosylaminopyrimidine deaminase/5-amino-6-(5-phosphoribosylamino)uracil reductase